MENKIIKGTKFTEYEARIKILVLSYSVRFENLASGFLRKALKLDDSAVSFGNTNQALSMNQKVTLLLDSKLLDKEYKKYIRTFFDIRNQFVHNASAKSFEDCLSFLDGTEKFITNEYNKKKIANEKADRQYAIKEKVNEDIIDKELLLFNINDKEKLLFKYWFSLAEDVITGFEKMVPKIFYHTTIHTK